MKYLYLLLIISIAAFHFSCEEGGLLIETDISQRSVMLIAPTGGVEISSNTVFFDWQAVQDAVQYEIQVATPDFDNAQQLLLNTTDSITSNELQLVVGDYQWRVRAMNSSYETAYSVASFKVVPLENFSDNTVILLSPDDNLITNTADQTLQWEAIDGATLYRIQVLENGSVNNEQTSATASIPINFSEGEFSWQVRGENGTQNTLYSSRGILVDVTNPNTPSLLQPADESILTSADVTFDWSREAISGSVEFDSIYVYRDMNLLDLVLKQQVTSPFETSLGNDMYYWFMKSFDEAGNQSNDSQIFSFTVNE